MIHRITIESDHHHEILSRSKELESVGVSTRQLTNPNPSIAYVTLILDPLGECRRSFPFPSKDLGDVLSWAGTSTQNIFNSISIILNSND